MNRAGRSPAPSGGGRASEIVDLHGLDVPENSTPTPRSQALATPPPFRALGEVAAQVVRDAAVARLSPRFHRLIEHLHRLGPRVVGELLIEVGDPVDVMLCLERYSRLNPDMIHAIGCDQFPQPRVCAVLD